MAIPKHNPLFLGKLFILVLLISLFTLPNGFTTQVQAQAQQAEDGYTKVIVKLKVPNINALTKDSNNYKAIWPGKSFEAKGHQADTRLKEAIEKVVNNVLYKLNGTGYKVNHTYVSIPYLALSVSTEALSVLTKLADVEEVAEDVPHYLGKTGDSENSPCGDDIAIEEDADIPELSSPKLNNTLTVINAVGAQNYGINGAGWYVALIDCGLRRSHEVFAGKTIVEKCFSVESECPNGQTTMSGTGAAAQQSVTCEFYEHGTRVAGVVAGSSGTITGVAPSANIIAVQVCSRTANNACVKDYASDVISAMDYIYSIRGSYSIAAVNLSLAYDPDDPNQITSTQQAAMSTSISNLYNVNIAVIAATGNDYECEKVWFPASDSNAIAAAATNDSDVPWSQGNSSTAVDFFAPGVLIYTSSGSSNTAYNGTWSGTSFSAAHLTGAWTLMKDAWSAGTVSEIKTLFTDNGNGVTSCTIDPPETCDDCHPYTPGYLTIPRINVLGAIGASPACATCHAPSSASTSTTKSKCPGLQAKETIKSNLPVTMAVPHHQR